MSTSTKTTPKTTRAYVLGFVFSVLLTIEAYLLVSHRVVNGNALIVILLALAAAQLFVQLYFFLHLGHETRPRWRLVAFLFMLLVVGILVIGTLWIMKNLEYNHQHDHQPTDSYIIHDEGVHQ